MSQWVTTVCPALVRDDEDVAVRQIESRAAGMSPAARHAFLVAEMEKAYRQTFPSPEQREAIEGYRQVGPC
jgi:hypothetical protein